MDLKDLKDVDESQKIMRVINKAALKGSIGEHSGTEQRMSLPFNLVSEYQKYEDLSRRDKKESQVAVDVHGKLCSISTCNEFLISCWTMIDEDFEPYDALINSEFGSASLVL